MNLSHLYYFKKLAELQHYTHAAQELFITQPTLSGAISTLEKELGVRLFERNGRSVVLTEYGEVFYEHVCLGLRAIEDGVEAVSAKSGASIGTVNVGTTFTIQDDYFPALVTAFENHEDNRVVVKVFQGFTNYLTEQLQRGAFDVVFCGKRDELTDLEYYPITRRSLVLYVRQDHPLAQHDEVSFEDIRDLDIITYRRGAPIGEMTNELTESYNMSNTQPKYDDDVSMASFLSYNVGNVAALMLDSIGGRLFPSLKMIRVKEIPQHFYTIYMAYNKKHNHSRATAKFIDFVKQYEGNDAPVEECHDEITLEEQSEQG